MKNETLLRIVIILFSTALFGYLIYLFHIAGYLPYWMSALMRLLCILLYIIVLRGFIKPKRGD